MKSHRDSTLESLTSQIIILKTQWHPRRSHSHCKIGTFEPSKPEDDTPNLTRPQMLAFHLRHSNPKSKSNARERGIRNLTHIQTKRPLRLARKIKGIPNQLWGESPQQLARKQSKTSIKKAAIAASSRSYEIDAGENLQKLMS
jgi:hypothetical protein